MMILNHIKSPQDIKQLSNVELEQLALELREKIINTVSQNGGHLAPSLGTIELTIALHRVFDTPSDKLVWDVGHQAYAHKLLTGRFDNFDSLRKLNGITGFPKIKESIHDAFGVGHASTSISAACGMAVARDLNNEDYNVVAIIGDGALSGGEAYEGLNNLGQSKRKMIVILNDNEMSISPNVGAISEYLSQIRIDDKYKRAKNDIKKILSHIPTLGESVLNTANYIKNGVIKGIVPGTIFESFGFTYIGPIYGHNIEELEHTLRKVSQNIDGPALIHVQTTKGKGYLPAENQPDKFHGVGKFDIETGKSSKGGSIKSYTEIFADSLIQISQNNKDIVTITAAMPSGTGLDKFKKYFPERCFDVGIAEEHAVTFAAGMATQGKIPVVAIYSTFLQRAYDQIIHDVALQKLKVIFAIDRAGLVGEDGPTHHGVFDIAFLRQIPNMVVMAPKDEDELKSLLYSATLYDKPCSIRYPRGNGIGVDLTEFKFIECGKSQLLSEGDKRVIVLATGSMVNEAKIAIDKLDREDINPTFLNMRFIKPLDEKLLDENLTRATDIITIEEGVIAGGLGSAILEYLAKKRQMHIRVHQLGINDEFVEQGTRSQLLDLCRIDSKHIYEKIKTIYRCDN